MNKHTESSGFVAVIGAANIDLTGTIKGQAIDGDSNPGEVTVSAGGVARNIAENLAHLGTNCELVTAIANDVWGMQVTEKCESLKIGMLNSFVSETQRTSTYLSMHDKQGELITAINDMAVLDSLDAKVLAKRIARLTKANAWVIDANLSDDALSFLFENCSDMPIWVDPVSTIKAKRLIPHLSKTHCLTPNLQEASILAGLPVNDSQDAPALAQKLHEKGVKQLLITLGEQGAFASDGASSVWLPAKPVSVKNVTGCGDAAIAALVHGATSGLNWPDSCDLAMSAAALTASTIQTNSPLLSTLGNPA